MLFHYFFPVNDVDTVWQHSCRRWVHAFAVCGMADRSVRCFCLVRYVCRYLQMQNEIGICGRSRFCLQIGAERREAAAFGRVDELVSGGVQQVDSGYLAFHGKRKVSPEE